MVAMLIWTTREVSFEPFPSEQFDVEAALEALCDHFYARALTRRLFGAVVSGDARGFEVTGLPWWVPAWWARSMVTVIFAGQGVHGRATCRTVRTVLAI